MEPSTFSRTYLQELSELNKRQVLDQTLHKHFGTVLDTARHGGTHYLFDTTVLNADFQRLPPRVLISLYLTDADLVTAFQRKFPGCDVSYQESWTDVNSTTRVLKKGITIDWS